MNRFELNFMKGATREEDLILRPDRVSLKNDARVDARFTIGDVRTRIDKIQANGGPNWELEYWEDIESHF